MRTYLDRELEIPGEVVLDFGKYKGTRIDEVPAEYLQSLYDYGRMGRYEREITLWVKAAELARNKEIERLIGTELARADVFYFDEEFSDLCRRYEDTIKKSEEKWRFMRLVGKAKLENNVKVLGDFLPLVMRHYIKEQQERFALDEN